MKARRKAAGVQEQRRRKTIASVLESFGYADGPFVRLINRGDKVEIWRRSCKCDHDCNCWDLADVRDATPEDLAAYALASAPYPGKPGKAAPEEDPLKRISDGLRKARPDLWHGYPPEMAR